MQADIKEAHLIRPVSGSTLWRSKPELILEAVSLNGLRGLSIRGKLPRSTTHPGHLFTPETNVLLLVYTEPQEPVPAHIQETVKRGSQRGGIRAT